MIGVDSIEPNTPRADRVRASGQLVFRMVGRISFARRQLGARHAIGAGKR